MIQLENCTGGSDPEREELEARQGWRFRPGNFSAAEIELASGNLDFSANRIYYAAFYAVTAALMQFGQKYKKHSAVRAAFHREFIKTELVPKEYGFLYDNVIMRHPDGKRRLDTYL